MCAKKHDAFTLIELLVVIAIIALLVSILLPSLHKAKMLASNVVCLTHERGVGMGLRLYSQEYGGYLPFVYGTDDDDYVITWDMFLAPFLDFGGKAFFDAALPSDRDYMSREMLRCPQIESDATSWKVLRDGTGKQHQQIQSHYVMNKAFASKDDYDNDAGGAVAVTAPSYLLIKKPNAKDVVHVNIDSAKKPGELYFFTEIGTSALHGYTYYNRDSELDCPELRMGMWHNKACNMLYVDGHGEHLTLDYLKDDEVPDFGESLNNKITPWFNGN